jgi:hypothetical protein
MQLIELSRYALFSAVRSHACQVLLKWRKLGSQKNQTIGRELQGFTVFIFRAVIVIFA